MDGGRIAPHDRARVSRTALEPGPCQQLPELPFPLFLGHRHLAMLIFARHSIANQAGFASPHPVKPEALVMPQGSRTFRFIPGEEEIMEVRISAERSRP